MESRTNVSTAREKPDSPEPGGKKRCLVWGLPTALADKDGS